MVIQYTPTPTPSISPSCPFFFVCRACVELMFVYLLKDPSGVFPPSWMSSDQNILLINFQRYSVKQPAVITAEHHWCISVVLVEYSSSPGY